MFGRKLMIRNVWFHVLSQVSALCPKDCWCPPDNPRCAADVALMLDGCGCCKVCGQQLFEDCSKTQPCDHTKGLECNFGGGSESVKGICRGTVTPVLFSTFCLFCYSCFSLCLPYFKLLYFVFLKISQIRWTAVWVQQQDIPEWGTLSSQLQTPVHLYGRSCWLCFPLSTRSHAAQTGLCRAEAGQDTRKMLRAAGVPWELCGEETQEKTQQREQRVWKWPC